MLLSGFRTRALELSFEVGHRRSPFRVSRVDIVPEDRDIVFNAGHGEALRPPKCFGRVPASARAQTRLELARNLSKRAPRAVPVAILSLVGFNALGRSLDPGSGSVERKTRGMNATLMYVGIGAVLATCVAILTIAVLFLQTRAATST